MGKKIRPRLYGNDDDSYTERWRQDGTGSPISPVFIYTDGQFAHVNKIELYGKSNLLISLLAIFSWFSIHTIFM
jgi:hypothetical protein